MKTKTETDPSKMEIWWEVSSGLGLAPVRVMSHTEKTVTVNSWGRARRTDKETRWSAFYPTFAEAIQAIRSRELANIENAKGEIEEAEKTIKKLDLVNEAKMIERLKSDEKKMREDAGKPIEF